MNKEEDQMVFSSDFARQRFEEQLKEQQHQEQPQQEQQQEKEKSQKQLEQQQYQQQQQQYEEEKHEIKFDTPMVIEEPRDYAPSYDYTSFQQLTKVDVKITETTLKDDPVSKYIIYTIRGTDKEGPFEAQQRYKNFDYLRSALVARWPGCYVPPLPPKQAMVTLHSNLSTQGNLETDFIEHRKIFLEYFLSELSIIQHLWYSEENQLFLRSTSNDLEKTYQNLPKQGNEQLIQKYQSNFISLQGVQKIEQK